MHGTKYRPLSDPQAFLSTLDRLTRHLFNLTKTIENEGETSCQEPAAKNRGTEGKEGVPATRRIRSRYQIAYPALYHQDCQCRQAAHAKPPQERSHEPSRFWSLKLARALVWQSFSNSSRALPGCQANRLSSSSAKAGANMSGCLTRRHDWLETDLFGRDVRKRRHCRRHCRPSPGRAPHYCRLRPDNWPR